MVIKIIKKCKNYENFIRNVTLVFKSEDIRHSFIRFIIRHPFARSDYSSFENAPDNWKCCLVSRYHIIFMAILILRQKIRLKFDTNVSCGNICLF
jgi:hypothetical protein